MARRRALGSSASRLQDIDYLAIDHSLPRCWVVRNRKLKLMPNNVSSIIAKILKEDIHQEGVNWKAVPDEQKKKYFQKFKNHFSWVPAVGPVVRTAFMKQAAVRYKEMISRCKNALQKPRCVSEEVWQKWLAFWSRPGVIANFEARPSYVYSRRRGGSHSDFFTDLLAMENEIERAPFQVFAAHP